MKTVSDLLDCIGYDPVERMHYIDRCVNGVSYSFSGYTHEEVARQVVGMVLEKLEEIESGEEW